MPDIEITHQTYNNILEAVGHTPLVRLQRSTQHLQSAIYAKVEALNPGGSAKDRVALRMVLDAEREGLLKPGGTVIEATAGNTGVGLAMVCAVRGYRCIFVLPDKMSNDKVRLLRSYGAEVVITPTNVPPDSPESYNGVATRLSREIQGAWRAAQFVNLSNPLSHYETTGPEIWEQTEGRVTAFVAAAGTGGTISGVGAYLKERNPRIRVIGADIEGSILSGGTPGAWKVEGIGEDFVPSTLNAQVIDEWIRISDAESFHTARRVARTEGILLGGSSGTALSAALRYAARGTAKDVIVVLCPDTGRNYLSKMYDEEWLAENGFADPEEAKSQTVGDLLTALHRKDKIHFLCPNDSLQKAADIFRTHGISQLPVMDQDRMVGSIQEVTIVHAQHRGINCQQTTLQGVMARPVLASQTPIEEVYRLLMAGNSAVAIHHEQQLEGIITRSDLIAFYESQSNEPESLRSIHAY